MFVSNSTYSLSLHAIFKLVILAIILRVMPIFHQTLKLSWKLLEGGIYMRKHNKVPAKV